MPFTRAFFASAAILLLCGLRPAVAAAPDEFLGIPWKSSPEVAKSLMAKREGITLKTESPDALLFTGGTFAAHPADRWELKFRDGQFRRGTVYVTIPPGKAANGVLLRNQQFEDYHKTLVAKYGKGARSGDGKHAQGFWKWMVSDPRSGQKETVSILLSYSWEPYAFKVEYASEPAGGAEVSTFGHPVKKTDL